MERVFQIIAVVLAGIAAFFLYSGHKDAGFVTVVFGCVSFFLSVRVQSKKRVEEENARLIEEKYGGESGVGRYLDEPVTEDHTIESSARELFKKDSDGK
ncbi:MAG: hypothetical protein R2681_05710 [Pyrinomonadaceae bacterium]